MSINWKDIAAEVNAEFAEELKTENFLVKHGLAEVKEEDVKAEFVSLDAVEREESEDFDSDENLTEMDCVSGSFVDLFDTVEN